MTIKAYRWYGGKLRAVHELNCLIPEHGAYYEPFMGSAALLLNHPRSRLEVLNDMDDDLVCFMRTMADRTKGKILAERLEKLWYGKSFFEEALACQKRHYKGMDDIERAVMVYILITQSFNSTRKSFSKSAYRDTRAYREDIQFHIPNVYERMQGVQVLNMDGIELLDRIAGNKDAFAFVDPPYRAELRGKGADRVYACEMPHKEQVKLLKTIRGARCKIMLCGYRAEKDGDLYDTYLLPYGWRCYKLKDMVKACQASRSKKDMGQEYIWVNYELPYEARYVISLREVGRRPGEGHAENTGNDTAEDNCRKKIHKNEGEEHMEKTVALEQRYLLTVSEASAYFNIGEKRLREIARYDPSAEFILTNGNRVMFKRKLFEAYLDKVSEI